MADLDLFQNGGALKTRLRASMVAGEAMYVIAPVHCRSYRTIVDGSIWSNPNDLFLSFSYPKVGDVVHVNYELLDGTSQVQCM